MRGIAAALDRIDRDRTGVVVAAFAFVLCGLWSWVLWAPFAYPSEAVRALVPHEPCQADAGAGACSALSIGVVLVPPLALMVLAFVFRKTLSALVGRVARWAPPGSRFLLAPLLASTLFALSWAGSHAAVGDQVGLLPQAFFPGVVGSFTVLVARWGQGLVRLFGPLFAARDLIPRRLRVLALIALPFGVGLWLAADKVLGVPTREQLTVVVGLVAGFLFMAPRAVAAPSATATKPPHEAGA